LLDREPLREEIDTRPGALVLEFGASWCGFCLAARPLFDRELARYPSVEHVQIEDGKGRPLGRSFGVKLWPTFVFLRDGREVTRIVRPRDAAAIEDALSKIAVDPTG
jgi:thioredoxin 1